LNLRSIAGQIESSPKFDRYKYALLASLDESCGPIEDFIPLSSRTSFMSDYVTFSSNLELKNIEQFRLKELRMLAPGYIDPTAESNVESLKKFRFLVEKGLELKTDQWTLALEKGTYDFSSSQSPVSFLETRLVSTIANENLEIARLASLRRVTVGGKYCASLKRQSLIALSGEGVPMPSESSRKSIGVFPDARDGEISKKAIATNSLIEKKCVSCHRSGIAPKIPFDHPEILSALLNSGKYKRGSLLEESLYRISLKSGYDRMPPGENLRNDEQEILESYLRSLVKVTKLTQ